MKVTFIDIKEGFVNQNKVCWINLVCMNNGIVFLKKSWPIKLPKNFNYVSKLCKINDLSNKKYLEFNELYELCLRELLDESLSVITSNENVMSMMKALYKYYGYTIASIKRLLVNAPDVCRNINIKDDVYSITENSSLGWPELEFNDIIIEKFKKISLNVSI